MKIVLKACIMGLLLINTSLIAQQKNELEPRHRVKSVKAAVGSFAQSEEKEILKTNNFKDMFTKGSVSGQLRSVYAGYQQKKNSNNDTYATAVGGELKFELASYNGFGGGVAFITSNDVSGLTGNRTEGKNNNELSSSSGQYTQLSEAYISYNYKDLTLIAGRQILETPLADSDDIRMIKNTFEAYVAKYNYVDIEFIAGNIVSWQGVDADLDDPWHRTTKDGTVFGGMTYQKTLEFNAWYYNFSNITNAFYVDAGINYVINKDMNLHATLQYLNESELNNSGYEAEIYGALVELVTYGIGFNLAYNKSNKKTDKHSYSGTGGGTIFTSMDIMILDNITKDRDASAVVCGISYDVKNWKFLYAYGSFSGEADGAGQKAHIIEQDIGFEYQMSKEFFIGAIFVMQEDKENSLSSDDDWTRMQVMLAYNF
ncbi:hypothetical protein [Sulfurimonas sp.]|uniref:hypothetical protein n=1 Tax=Sulfurimonas sp. TaxID=2022749 RepID=UPI002AB012D6|nr:hypothetical protein [Sulfurimonas sp.]